MKVSRVHHCFAQELCEPRPKRCNCRKLVRREYAEAMVSNSEAQRIILKRVDTGRVVAQQCRICLNTLQLAGSCRLCAGSGFITEPVFELFYHPTDVVLISVLSPATCNNYGVVYHIDVATLMKKTPRVETIERQHIERAYVSEDTTESERIELYGEMNKQELQSLIRFY